MAGASVRGRNKSIGEFVHYRKVQSAGIYDEIRYSARSKYDRWFLFYDTLLRDNNNILLQRMDSSPAGS